ncbi:MAG: flavodoxin [Dialister invisus]
MKILTVYFSKTGHTKAIAEMIHKAVGGDLGEIRTKRSYAPSYGMAVLQGGLEQLRKSLPELAEMPETAEYDVIFVGSPVWWFTLTPAVKSFISRAEWKGSGYILSLQAAGSRERRQMILKDCWKIKARW